MTGHWFGPKPTRTGGTGSGHPIMFGEPQPTNHFEPFPDGGGYPKGFLEWAYRTMRVSNTNRVLHMCSGSVQTGIRVDIRPELNPDIVADCRHIPLPDESFGWILADPPYSEDYATNLYGTGDHYPLPGQIAREACRLLKPGGLFGLLHFQVPMIRKPLEIVGVYGVTTGSGYAIRAWTLCRKALRPPMFGEHQ